MDKIGERIKNLLEYRGLTQKQLAQKSGVTEAAISRYINGERTPRAVTVAAIAKALDVSPAEIIGEKPCDIDELDNAVRLIARNAGDLTEQQKLEILSAIAKM